MLKTNTIFHIGLSIFLILIAVSCEKDPNTYELSGKLENIEGGYFYMSYETGDSIHIDTILVNKKGEFSVENKIDTLTEMSLFFNQNTQTIFFFANKGWEVKLKGDVLFPDLIEITGGDVNNDLTDFKNKNKDLLKSRAEILNAAVKRKEKSDSLIVKDYVMDLKSINFELSNAAADYVKSNPDKIASVMLISTFFKDETSIPRLDENLSLLKGKALDYPLTKDLKKFRDRVKMSAVGSMAPNFSLENTKGKKINFSDFRGKYVLLSFIATTCQVCLDERPNSIAIYNELKKQKKNIEFISIVKDVEIKPIPSDISNSEKWDILPVNGGWSSKVFDMYYIREIPYNILISPSGYILERDLPIEAVAQKLEELTDSKQK